MYLRSEFGLKLVIAENFRNDADGFIDVEGFKRKYEVLYADKKLSFDLTDGAKTLKISE